MNDTTSNRGWRPPQWATGGVQTMFSADIPNADGSTTPTVLVFDAVLRLDHHQSLRKTEHPVQSGADISDHAFILPARLVTEIGMSDVMDRFIPSSFTSNVSKSVSAHETLLMLQKKRVPLTIVTRLRTYFNMLVVDVHTPDSVQTMHGLRATVTFEEVLTATVAQIVSSARPSQTASTELGGVQASAPPDSVDAFDVNKAAAQASHSQIEKPPSSMMSSHNASAPAGFYDVPGAGDYSSSRVDISNNFWEKQRNR